MRRLILLILTLALLPLPVLAQSGGDYDLARWTVDGGGARLSATSYLLQGTAGQSEAGAALSSGDYRLVGGFWPGGAGADQHAIYLPRCSVTGSSEAWLSG